MFEPAADIVDQYRIHLQNQSETGDQLLHRRALYYTEPDHIVFPAVTKHLESFDVDSLIKFINLKQEVIFKVVEVEARLILKPVVVM